MESNFELKARIDSLAAAREVALRVATEHLGVQHQRDIFFNSPNGRLKLRILADDQGELIWYDRSDKPEGRESFYTIFRTDTPDALVAALTPALGTQVTVVKRREIFLCENVRIHLDQVEQLGDFIEFEAVLSPECDSAEGRRRVERLCREFGVGAEDIVSWAYADMLQ